MKLIERLARGRSSAGIDAPVDRTEGEATSLLTQAAGMLFGLLPAFLMGRAAHAASLQHAAGGEDTAAADHQTTALGGTELAHGATDAASPIGHTASAAVADHAHDVALAPHHAPGAAPLDGLAYGGHAPSASSGAPQPLHLPEATHLAPAGSDVPTTPAHADASQASASQGAIDQIGHAGDLLPDAGRPHVGSEAAHALGSTKEALHDTTAALQTGISRVTHDADAVAHHATSLAGHLAGTATHDLKDTVHQTTSAASHVVDTAMHGLEDTVHQTTSAASHVADPAVHTISSSVGADLGDTAQAANDVVGHTTATSLGAADALASGHSLIQGYSPSDTGSALHASAPGPSSALPQPAASLHHALDDVGHATSSSSESAPLHVPLIGQSYADHGGAHDGGFTLHAIHL